MRRFWKPLSYFITLLLGGVLTLACLAALMIYSRVAPADEAFQQACPRFTPEEVREEYIRSWLRSAAKDERKAVIGLDSLSFNTAPTFEGKTWFGKLQVSGSKGSDEAYVILDCRTGMFDYSGTELSSGQ